MISYFYHKKRYTEFCEDSFTALVFDLLKYLPIDVFWEILKKSLCQDKLPKESGDMLSIHFWEKWDPSDTTNSKYVEPDVFIRFNGFDVLIEAKRNDEKGQYQSQIYGEIQGYINEFGSEEETLYFIQLGGLTDNNDIEDDNREGIIIKHCKTNWSRILEQIVYERKRIEPINHYNISAYKRILDDLIKGFELHGYFKMFWLKDLKHIEINNNKITWFDYAQ